MLFAAPAAADAKAYKLGDRTLREGSHGRDVRALQRYLDRTGIETGVDGVFGRDTKRAVRTFEESQRRTVDGIVTKPDVAVLKDVAINGGAVASAAATGGALPRNEKIQLPPPEQPPPLQLGPGEIATVDANGYAVAPASAPPVVQAIIAAGNRIAKMPYIYGGGHGQWEDAGYDCSGSVSYALHGAGLLEEAMPSGNFMNWGDPGPGQWVTLYANGGHIYMVVAGLRFDTSGRSRARTRWQADMRSGRGYTVRHIAGL